MVVLVRLCAVSPRRRCRTDRAAAQAAHAAALAGRRRAARWQTRPRAGRVSDLLDATGRQPDVAADRLARVLPLRVRLRVRLRPLPGHAHACRRGLAAQGRGLIVRGCPVLASLYCRAPLSRFTRCPWTAIGSPSRRAALDCGRDRADPGFAWLPSPGVQLVVQPRGIARPLGGRLMPHGAAGAIAQPKTISLSLSLHLARLSC